MPHRRRYKQTRPFQDRIFDFLAEARQKAEESPDGIEREKMIKRIESAKTAAPYRTASCIMKAADPVTIQSGPFVPSRADCSVLGIVSRIPSPPHRPIMIQDHHPRLN